MEKDTAAIRAHKASIENAMAGNKEAWLALFTDDAVVHDPVGKSDHDPEGKGFRGKEQLGTFWDMMIGPGNLLIIPQKRYPCGDNIVAVAMMVTNYLGDIKTYIEMVAVYEVNDAGKLVSLKVYWDTEAVAAQLPDM